jgi:lipopolysaccharide biosynthesis glycosyltransferase
MVARYLILDWPDAWRYQPLLYVDADIVFDRDVTPMLHAIAMSDRIAAPVELMSPLARNPSVGATLLQRDLCSPGYMAGFNSGTLGIPNVRAHAETLRLIRRIIANHSLLHGREALPYADQEIANYVFISTCPFRHWPDLAFRPVWRRRCSPGRALRARALLAGAGYSRQNAGDA